VQTIAIVGAGAAGCNWLVPDLITIETLAPIERPNWEPVFVAILNSCSASIGGEIPGEFIICMLASKPSIV